MSHKVFRFLLALLTVSCLILAFSGCTQNSQSEPQNRQESINEENTLCQEENTELNQEEPETLKAPEKNVSDNSIVGTWQKIETDSENKNALDLTLANDGRFSLYELKEEPVTSESDLPPAQTASSVIKGTYSVENNQLTLNFNEVNITGESAYPEWFEENPQGTSKIYSYKLEGDNLVLTGESGQETQFIRTQSE